MLKVKKGIGAARVGLRVGAGAGFLVGIVIVAIVIPEIGGITILTTTVGAIAGAMIGDMIGTTTNKFFLNGQYSNFEEFKNKMIKRGVKRRSR